jgi:hypothetical protein
MDRSRIRIAFALIGFLFACCCVAAGRQTSSTAPAAPHGTLLLHPDYDCTVKVDGAIVAHLKSGGAQQVRVTFGQHLIQATSPEGYHWETVLEVKQAGQMVVAIPLQAVANQAASNKAIEKTASQWVGDWAGGSGFQIPDTVNNPNFYDYGYLWYTFHITPSGQCSVTVESSFDDGFQRDGETSSNFRQRMMQQARTAHTGSNTFGCSISDQGISLNGVSVTNDHQLTFRDSFSQAGDQFTVALQKVANAGEAAQLQSNQLALQQSQQVQASQAAASKAFEPLMQYFRGPWHFEGKKTDQWFSSECEADKEYEGDLYLNNIDPEQGQILGTLSFTRSGTVTRDDTTEDEPSCSMKLVSGEKVTDYTFTEEWSVKLTCDAPGYIKCEVTGERTSCDEDYCQPDWNKEIGEIDFPTREPEHFLIIQMDQFYWQFVIMDFRRN